MRHKFLGIGEPGNYTAAPKAVSDDGCCGVRTARSNLPSAGSAD